MPFAVVRRHAEFELAPCKRQKLVNPLTSPCQGLAIAQCHLLRWLGQCVQKVVSGSAAPVGSAQRLDG